MFVTARIRKFTPFARLAAHLQAPLYRNGYALVFSSAATSALGLVYWMLAARYYPTEVIGLNAALLSALRWLRVVWQRWSGNAAHKAAAPRSVRV